MVNNGLLFKINNVTKIETEAPKVQQSTPKSSKHMGPSEPSSSELY